MKEKSDLPSREAVEAAYRFRSSTDFYLFVRGLMIPTPDGVKLFDSCMAPFQRAVFQEMSPSLRAIQLGTKPPTGRWWLERTKGAGKDSDLATAILWLLAFPVRPIYLQVGAADKDQAGIIRRRMEDILHYNPWLASYVVVRAYTASNIPGRFAVLDILAADIAGSHGETPDLLVINELSHVTKWEFVENLLDNADKVANGMVVIATNAGFKGTKAEVLRKAAESKPKRWAMRLWKEPAPWISKENVEDAKRRELASRFNRLWWGKWASGKGDALGEDDIDKCLGAYPGPLTKPEKNWEYVAGLDLGVTHDHSGFVIVGINQIEQRMRLAWMKGWSPRGKHEVDLVDVKSTVLAMFRLFKLRYVGYDPTECRLMAQELRRQGVPMQEMSFASPKNLSVMAASLVQSVGKNLGAYEDDEGRLRRDFGKLNIVEKTYGYKLEAVSDETGHADVGAALAIALPRAIDLLAGRAGLQETDDLMDGSEDATDEEMGEMPDELQGIYDSVAPIRKDRGQIGI